MNLLPIIISPTTLQPVQGLLHWPSLLLLKHFSVLGPRAFALAIPSACNGFPSGVVRSMSNATLLERPSLSPHPALFFFIMPIILWHCVIYVFVSIC